MRLLPNALRSLWLFAGLLIAAMLNAQDVPSAEPEVSRIRIEFQGFQPVSDEYVRSNVQLRSGMAYNPVLVDQSIRSLYTTNQFEFIEVKVEQADAGKVDVIFVVVPKYTIGAIEFNGNEGFSPERLTTKGEIESGVPLDEYWVSLAGEKIQDYYIEKGYPDVAVEYRINRDAETGYATVIYDIEAGGKVKITEIDFTGLNAFTARQLRKQLQTKKTNWIAWLTGAGIYDANQFDEDLDLLRAFYRNRGFLDVEIDADQVEIEYQTAKKIQITIPITEGRRYVLGELSVANHSIFTAGELLGAMRLQEGEPFSPERIDAAASALRDYYASRGYLESYVRAERVPNMQTRRIDVVFRIRESEKFYVESINVEGNTKTKTRVILRELALRPGDVFDLKRMETSERRLKNTQFFEDVRLNPEATNVPGRKDLGVTVREGRTGSFSFGAGFGSVQSAVIFFELTQGNFDLFNWRNGFQGDGQKMRLRGSFGSQSNELIVAFEEPWLFEQRLAFGVELFRRESDYVSSDYNELRTGFELYLRRRLFELVEARLSYRYEIVEIFDVAGVPGVDDPTVADVFEEAEGEEVVSKVGLTFLRDTRDSLLFTSRGNRTTLSTQWAGLGGDINYFKLEGRMAHFIPTFETLDQTLAIYARAGTAIPYGDSDTIPFYDRFYLGGPDSLRGYDYRDIGPRDADDATESIGGNTYTMLSFEYGFRIAEPLGLVVFYDWGFVNEDDSDFSPSNYADNWGVGARLMMMGSPLKLDLGFPITDPTGEADGSQFNFSFGTRF